MFGKQRENSLKVQVLLSRVTSWVREEGRWFGPSVPFVIHHLKEAACTHLQLEVCPRCADGRPSLSIPSWTSQIHFWLFFVDSWMQTQVHISYLALLALEHSKGFSVSRISYGLLKGFYSLSALSTPPGKHHTSPATSGLVRRHRWLSSSPIISEQQGVISHREAGLCIFRMRCFHSILSSLASSLALFWQVNRRSRNEGMQTHYMRRQVERDFSLSEFIPLDLQLTPKLLQ